MVSSASLTCGALPAGSSRAKLRSSFWGGEKVNFFRTHSPRLRRAVVPVSLSVTLRRVPSRPSSVTRPDDRMHPLFRRIRYLTLACGVLLVSAHLLADDKPAAV